MHEPPTEAHQTDDRLLDRARQDDRAAIDALIRRYANLVHGVALRQTGDPHLAADVSQAVFIIFVRRIRSIRHARALPAWFLQTTRLAVRGAARSAARRKAHERFAALPEQIMIDPCPDDLEHLSQLDEVIAKLGKTDRDLVLMKYYQGWEMSAISAALGISQETARKRLSRAIERIRTIFIKRRATMSATAVAGLLGAAGAHCAPAAVVQASIAATASATASGLGAAIAGKLAGALLWSKLKLATLALVTTFGTVGAVWALQEPRATDAALAPAAATQPQPPAAPQVPQLKALEPHYALAEGQVLRLIEPPFPAARDEWLANEMRMPGDRVGNLGFLYTPAGLRWKYMSMSGLRLDNAIRHAFGLDSYLVTGLELVQWEPIRADIVVRQDASTQQKLDAFAELIAQRTHQVVKFAQQKIPRPCLVLRGKTGVGPKNKRGRHAVLVSQTPLDERSRSLLINEPREARLDGYSYESDMSRVAEKLAAPFITEAVTGFWLNGNFVVAPDATLDPADPEYVPKLKRIAENFRAQIGGDWSVEVREIEVWVIQRVAL
jgi:RNA polymerase sigma factor (sigma-70 family)